MTDHDEHPLDYLPELALGVLSESEAAPLRAHLATCDMCSGEYEEMSRVARLLPLVVEDVEPAATLKESLFERIAAEANVVAFPTGGAVMRPRPWQWVGAIAASVAGLLIVGGLSGFALRGDGSNESLERDSARQAQVVESAARGDLKTARGAQGGERVTLLRAPGSKNAFAYTEGLRPLPEGKAYQAWFTKDGKTFEPSAVFTTAAGGAWLPASDAIDSYAAMGLTIEDAAGAKTPSSAPFVVVELGKVVRAR